MTSPGREHDSASATGRRVQLSADAVVVEYIHAISERHRAGDAAVEPAGCEHEAGRR
jgi:hypothetical protein